MVASSSIDGPSRRRHSSSPGGRRQREELSEEEEGGRADRQTDIAPAAAALHRFPIQWTLSSSSSQVDRFLLSLYRIGVESS